MRQRSRVFLRLLAFGLVALPATALLAAPAAAQTSTPAVLPSTLTVTTTYPSITVDPGGEARYPIQVTAPSPQRVDLSVVGVPEGFKATFKGGGAIVGSVTTTVTDPPDLTLSVKVPPDAGSQTYKLTVKASAASGSTQLPLDLVVADTSGGEVTMTTDFPSLRGPSSSTFQFNLRLTNDTAQEVTFGLDTTGPEGWDVQARPSSQAQAATAVVGAGDNENIQVTVKPASDAAAGAYPITVTATGGPVPVTTPLEVDLTGSYRLTLTTSDGRLNTQVSTGGSTPFTVVVLNNGTADLENVKLSGSAPPGWKVTWDSDTIASIAVGGQAQGIATITPAGDATAGDYIITMSARADQANDSIDVRTTVETSSIWGFAALGLIVIVLVGLFLVFRRFGRR